VLVDERAAKRELREGNEPGCIVRGHQGRLAQLTREKTLVNLGPVVAVNLNVQHVETVMVVHDGLATTRACLESLRLTDEPFALVVVDNGSTDDTPRWFRDFPYAWPLRYVRNDSNGSVLLGADDV